MKAATAELNAFDYHLLAWSKFEIEIRETKYGTFETMRGIPGRERLLTSLEWNAWRVGRDYVTLYARRPKMRRRKWTPIAANGATGTTIW